MPLIAELLATPHELPDASRYTVANGVLYMISGVTFLTAPGAVQAIFADPPFAGHDEASVRVVGLLIVTIGWLAMFGGLTGQRRFVAATVVSRILFVSGRSGAAGDGRLVPTHIVHIRSPGPGACDRRLDLSEPGRENFRQYGTINEADVRLKI